MTMTAVRPGADIRRRKLPAWLWPTAIWLAVAAATLWTRPALVSIESTLHASAWWLWLGQSDVSYLPLAPAERPPVLFWTIHLGWWLFGPSGAVARLAAAVFELGALWLIIPLARLLWPRQDETVRLAPLIAVGSGAFVAYAAMTLLDLPLLFFSVLGLLGVALAWRQRPAAGWLLFGIALGLGLLSAGATALLLMLPAALLAPLALGGPMAPDWRRWYAGAFAGLILAAAVSLSWPLATGASASDGRWLAQLLQPPLVAAVEDDRPFYWYLLALPLALYPWLWWRSLWKATGRGHEVLREPGAQLCLIAATAALVAGLATGRHSYGLLPLLPPFALVAARLLSAYAGKPKDFHAAVPGMLALFVCLVFFLLNIVPVAHLDALWRQLFEDELPLWLGGISLLSGLTLLAGSYVLTLLTPRALPARVMQLALLPVLLALTVNLEFALQLRPFFDLKPMAQQIRALQAEGRPVAALNGYDGVFDFAGRLEQPLVIVADIPAAVAWAKAHPEGAMVSFFRGGILHLPERPLYLGNADEDRVALWSNASVAATGGRALVPRF